MPFHQGVGTYGERFPRTVTDCREDGRRANKGDILFSVRAPVGRLNIADREMIIGRGLSAIRHRKEHNHYLYYLLKTAFVNEDIIGNGSIFNSVGKDELAKFPIFEPEPSLVEKFDAMVSKMDERITMLIQAAECLRSSRDALLPRLISGKLSVENLDIKFPPGMMDELKAEPAAHAGFQRAGQQPLSVVWTVDIPSTDYLARVADFDEHFLNVAVDGETTSMEVIQLCYFESELLFNSEAEEITHTSITLSGVKRHRGRNQATSM